MKQDTSKRREAAQEAAPGGQSPDPALLALVRYLARAAAERDYAASGGGGTPPGDPEGDQ